MDETQLSALDDQKEHLTPQEVCERFPGVTLNTLAVWRHYRRGPDFIAVGRRIFYEREVFERWRESQTTHCNPDVTHLPRRRS